MNENWKDVVGYEGLYKVSDCGRVYNCKRNKFLSTPTNRKKKYVDVVLVREGVSKQFKVHRLVAQAFIPNPDNYPFVNHKDENPTNNHVENLEWCTNEYNLRYGTAPKRQALSRSVLSKEQIEESYRLLNDGYSISDLGKLYKVSPQTVSRALTKDKKYSCDGLNVSTTYENIRNNGITIMGVKHRKLSDETIKECYSRYRSGETLTSLSKYYGVSIASLSNIFNGKTKQSKVLMKEV